MGLHVTTLKNDFKLLHLSKFIHNIASKAMDPVRNVLEYDKSVVTHTFKLLVIILYITAVLSNSPIQSLYEVPHKMRKKMS